LPQPLREFRLGYGREIGVHFGTPIQIHNFERRQIQLPEWRHQPAKKNIGTYFEPKLNNRFVVYMERIPTYLIHRVIRPVISTDGEKYKYDDLITVNPNYKRSGSVRIFKYEYIKSGQVSKRLGCIKDDAVYIHYESDLELVKEKLK
jgi:hypothetical protein